MKRIITSLMLLLLCGSVQAQIQSWVPLGPRDSVQVSNSSPYYYSLALNNSGDPLVAFTDPESDGKATVKKYDGAHWVSVGLPGFSNDYISDISLAISNSGTPYVAYIDGSLSSKVTVKKYDGTSWVDVGTPGFSVSNVGNIKLAVSSTGTPYVAYRESYVHNFKVSVKEYNGTAWADVGTPGISVGQANFISLVLDANDVPYLAYQDVGQANKAIVKKFDNTSWVNIGGGSVSAAAAAKESLAIDGSGTPYLMYTDVARNDSGIVSKFDGTNWVSVGAAQPFPKTITSASITIDGGTPYVAYTYMANISNYGTKTIVKKYSGGSWVDMAPQGLSIGNGGGASIVVRNGVPCVIYRDETNANKMCVKKYNGSNWIRLYTSGISEAKAGLPFLAMDTAAVPYISYNDDERIGRISVKKYNGIQWVHVDTAGFSFNASYESAMAFSRTTNTPYIVFTDGGISVKKYDGTHWVDVGPANFSDGPPTSPSIVVDAAGTPYVAFQQRGIANDYRIAVKKFNGSQWIDVGAPKFSEKNVGTVSLALSGNGTLYVAYNYLDFVNGGNQVSVKRYDGTNWVAVGPTNISTNNGEREKIAIDGNSVPYVAFWDYDLVNYLYKLVVKKYDGTNWVDISNNAFAMTDAATPLHLVIGSNNIPYITYLDSAYNNRRVVKKYENGTWVYAGTPPITPLSADYATMAGNEKKVLVAYASGAGAFVQAYYFVAPVLICDTVTTLSITNITSNSAEINWSPVAIASDYECIVDQNAGTPTTGGNPIIGTIHSANGLLPNTTYYVHHRTHCYGTNYSPWIVSSFTTDLLCDTPTNLTVSNINATDADVSWNAVTGSANYECIVNTTAAAPTVAGTVVTGTSYHQGGLSATTTYYAHVRTHCVGTNYSVWITKEFVTDRVCIAPASASMVISNIISSGAEVNWGASARSVGYEYITDQIITAPTVAGTSTITTNYTVTGLTPTTSYFAHIRSACSVNNFSAWVTKQFSTLGLCDTPTSISVSNITTNSADVSWSAMPFAANYEYIVDQVATAPVIAGTSTTNTTTTATGLLPGTVYYAHARIFCFGNPGGSLWITTSFTTLCDTPATITISNISGNSADIGWASVAGAAGYEYQVDQLATAPASGTAITGTTYTATGLTSATTYYFHLRTECAAGNFSDWMNRLFVTAPVGIAQLNNDGFEVTAFPNPTAGFVTVYITGYKGTASLRLIDVTGKTVREMNIQDKARIDISLHNLAAGTYWLKYVDDVHNKVISIQRK